MRGNKKAKIIKIRALIFIILVTVIIGVSLLLGKLFSNKDGVTMAEVSRIIMLSENEGDYYSSSNDGYWYTPYIDYVKEKHIFSSVNAKKNITKKQIRQLMNYLGFTEVKNKDYFVDTTYKTYSVRGFKLTRSNFADFYMSLKSVFENGDAIHKIDATAVGYIDNSNKLEADKLCTDEGNFNFFGVNVNQCIDKKYSFLTKNDSILLVIDEISTDVHLENVWIKNVEENLITINMYGVTRNFKISGSDGEIEKSLADIDLKSGQLVNIDIKSNKISGKVLAITEEYIELEEYGKVPVDDKFILYDEFENYVIRNQEGLIVGYDISEFTVARGEIVGAVIVKPFDADNIRVLIKTTGYKSSFHNSVSLKCDTRMVMKMGDNQWDYEAGDIVNISYDDDKIVIFAENNKDAQIVNAYVEQNQNDNSLYGDGERIYIKPENNGNITLLNVERSQGNPEYEGDFEIVCTAGEFVIINDINIEKYLKRVVPSEMPVSFGVEALKVQAICARSYSYKYLIGGGYNEFGAHVDDSTQFQVYNNTLESEASNEAIYCTKGQMLKYNGEVVKTYYYSTSCGVTADLSLWGSDSTDYPYYESVEVGSEHRDIDYTNEEQFRQFINNYYETDYDSCFGYYRWNFQISKIRYSEIINKHLQEVLVSQPERVLLQDGDYFVKESFGTIGTVEDIQVVKRVNGGAATEVVISGSTATVKIKTESIIRKVLGTNEVEVNTLKGTVIREALPSSFVIFDKVNENGFEGFKITGGGFGHGIGMSQDAVKTMVESGMNYREILMFFYPGTTV